MHYVIFFLFAITSTIALKLWLDKKLIKSKSDYNSSENRHKILFREYQELKRINVGLTENVQDLVDLYEITKELTKYLTFDEVFVTFRERLKKTIHIDDCQFIKEDIDPSKLSGYSIFPLEIDEEMVGHFAIKGLKRAARDKFYILFDQFLLILKRVLLYEKIEDLSITDSLTNLYLRSYFLKRLEQEIERSKKFNLSFALLMLDLDHFKSYNDRYGHLVGDVLLSSVAKIVKDSVRQIDVISRYGGEEFLIMLPNTHRQEAEYISLRLRQEIENKQIRAYDEELQITVSIGCSLFPEDAENSEPLIDKADQALYKAKKACRNRVCFWAE